MDAALLIFGACAVFVRVLLTILETFMNAFIWVRRMAILAALVLPLIPLSSEAAGTNQHLSALDTWNGVGGGSPGAMSLEHDADPMSRFVAGRRYLIGAAGSGQDKLAEKGLALIASAARDGFAPAARFAGSLYLEGMLVPRDLPRGVGLLTMAADAGDPESQRELGDLLADGEAQIRDLGKAVHWYRTVLNNPAADPSRDRLFEVQMRLATLLAEGLGTPADPDAALTLWQQAATDSNYPPAWHALGDAHASGLAGKVDTKAAMKAYHKALHAYSTGGLKFQIGRHTALKESERIVEQMVSLGAKGNTLKKARAQLALMN